MSIFKSIFTLALLALTITLSANNDPGKLRIKSKVVEDNAIVIQVFNLQQMPTSVSISDLEGSNTYFQKNIRRHNGYSLKLDLAELTDGRYILEVKQGEVIKKQIILIRGNYPQLSSIAG
ncbi:MAG: hypothetical protein R2824_10430 [Saprospiraceae bacterium]|nr:hypothetical protein [Lewinella sp.]